MSRDRFLVFLAVVCLTVAAGLALWWQASGGSPVAGKRSAADPPAAAAPSQQSAPSPTSRPRRERAEPRVETTARQRSPRPPVEPAMPTVLQLPSLGVSAPVTPVGTDVGRTLVPPSDYTTVGWWSPGAQPGAEQGTAIIAGHTVHTGGGALDDLEQVQPGDRVVVERDGADLAYRVASVTIYEKASLAERADQIFAQDGPGRLAVVTCEDWTGEIYLSNVVVIATDPQVLTRQ